VSGEKTYLVFICGSALRGQPDHANLSGAKFVGEAASSKNYRIHAVKDGWHPGIYEVEAHGITIPGELYELSSEQYKHLVATEPPDMYPSEIMLDDGRHAVAMLYPEELIREGNWQDISNYGGWKAFKASAD